MPLFVFYVKLTTASILHNLISSNLPVMENVRNTVVSYVPECGIMSLN